MSNNIEKTDEKPDFFKMGKKHAKDSFAEMENKARSIEETYGKAQKDAFTLGFLFEVSEYSKVDPYEQVLFDSSTVENGIKGRSL